METTVAAAPAPPPAPLSVCSNSSSTAAATRKSKKNSRKRRARQWTYYIETLKSTIDCIYELCRAEQSLNGCKEAVMYLQNSARDFEALIESIKVEQEWEEAEDKPQAVAWEVRKTMSSPSHVIKEVAANSGLIDVLPISPLMFSEVVKAGGRRMATATAQQQQAVAALTAAHPPGHMARKEDEEEAGWQLVRARRRRSVSSLTEDSRQADEDEEGITGERKEPAALVRPSNVYERLSGSAVATRRQQRTHSLTSSVLTDNESGQKGGGLAGRYMCPRSAMDLPQTKASMAKMAYSRQLLWQRTQSTLIEKMKARQARYRSANFGEEVTVAAPRPRRVVPNSAANFADGAVAVVASGRTTSTRQPRVVDVLGPRPASVAGGAIDREGSGELSRSLESIRETAEDDKTEHIPSDPKPSTEEGDKEENAKNTVDEITPVPSPRKVMPNRAEETIIRDTRSEPLPCRRARRSLADHDDTASLLSSTAPPELADAVVEELEGDAEWRELTEEEESLAFEERSLNIEIEHEKSKSIDAELERQVAAEAAELELGEKEEEEKAALAAEATSAAASAAASAEGKEEGPADNSFMGLVMKWEQEMKDFAHMSWSEIVEREFAGHLREPGDAAARHERMLSPSRRRCGKNDEDLSKKHEEKQRRADELREKLQRERAEKLQKLWAKVEEVRQKREAVIERKRLHMITKMEKAKENREKNLEEVVKRARDDEQRVLEVHLINSLEAGNMRHDQRMRVINAESRRQAMMAEERARQAAKEARAEERRSQRTTNTETVRKRETGVLEIAAKTSEPEEEKAEVINENEEPVANGASEEAVENGEIPDIQVKHDWSFLSDSDALLQKWPLLDSVAEHRFKCTLCDVEMRSELEAVAHSLSSRHSTSRASRDGHAIITSIDALPAEMSSAICSVRCGSSETPSVHPDGSSVAGSGRSRDQPTAAERARRKRAKRECNRVAQQARDAVAAMARAVAGRDGPAGDEWRAILAAADLGTVLDENARRELELFSKKEKPKTASAALDEFLREYAREEPRQESELILLALTDGLLRVACREWLPESATVSDSAAPGPAETRTYELFTRIMQKAPSVFERLLSCDVRRLRLLSMMLSRLSRDATATCRAAGPSATVTHTRIALRILGHFTALSGENQTLCCVLEAPRRLANFPMAYLAYPTLRVQLLPTLATLIFRNTVAAAQMASVLSVDHIVMFLEAASKPNSPESTISVVIEDVLPRPIWNDVIEFCRQFMQGIQSN